MKQILEGLVAAFSLYSILPVPGRWVKWDHDSMRYTLCFFPAVGIVLLLAELAWHLAAYRLGVSTILYGVVAALLPVLLSGGIHLDGLIDTMDAVGSHAVPARKLEILQDPRTGAFGVMSCVGYLLLSAGLWAQIYLNGRHILMAAMGFVLSRAFASLSIVSISTARQTGMVALLSGSASVSSVKMCATVFFAMALLTTLFLDSIMGIVTAILCLLGYLLHRWYILREFGGNTGDLTGFLIMNTELVCLVTAAVGGMLV